VREDLKQGETLVLGGHSECRVVGTMARSREKRSREVQRSGMMGAWTESPGDEAKARTTAENIDSLVTGWTDLQVQA
jgi:hypothetical protein